MRCGEIYRHTLSRGHNGFRVRRGGMTSSKESQRSDDPYNLNRFVHAQEDNYEQALAEMRSGKKRTHWM